MFDTQNAKMSLVDLLRTDKNFISREMYAAAVQRQFRIVVDEMTPDPVMTEQRERDLALIEAYEEQHPASKHLITEVVISNPSGPPPDEL